MTLWTFAFLFSFILLLPIFYPKGLDEWLDTALQPDYLILLGSPLAALALARGFTANKVESQTEVKPYAPPSLPGVVPPDSYLSVASSGSAIASGTTSSTGAPSSLTNLVTTDAGQADVFKFQYLCLNVVVLAYFLIIFLPHAGDGLPDLPDTLVALAAVSAAGYSTNKYVQTDLWPTISSVVPDRIVFGDDTSGDKQLHIYGVNFGDQDPNATSEMSQVLLDGRALLRQDRLEV